MQNSYNDVNNDPELANQSELAKAFLKFTSETNDFGISLYKTPNSAIASGTSNWEKLTLDPAQPGGIKNSPCN